MRGGFFRVGLALCVLTVLAGPASADVTLYTDALASGWQDWSWGGVTRNFAQGSPVHGGAAAIGVTYMDGWSGLQLGNPSAVDVSAYDSLRFWVHGGSAGGQGVQVTVGSNASGLSVSQTIVPAANAWTRVDVALSDLGSPRQVDYIQWFNATPGAQPPYSLDDVAFVSAGLPTPTPAPPGNGPALTVDASAGRHAINPEIYGMNFADEALASELALPVRRFGGNSTTRYNWQNDTSNHASDWYFENLPDDNPNPGQLPNGSASDQFVEQDRRTGTATLLTVPLIGWTPKSRALACGFAVSKYGAQQSTDPWQPDCGNGVTSGGADVTGNDPADTSTAIGPAFVQAWIAHLQSRYGTAASGGVRFYDLDNEPMLWSDTHRDVHPAPTSYDEMRTRTYAYAAAIKASDPAALTLGPVEWGWTGYFWSALDWSAGGAWWNSPQDRLAHGDVPFVEWYLQQMRAYEQQHGTRILDYVDVHYYPQAAGVSLSPAGNAATQALRLRSTRSLWDPSYVDESWIGDAVRLVPRMHEWVASDYPGTKTAVTEYNWGGLEAVNGALAQGDVLGIFGREGLDLATLWAPPTASQPGAYAFRMYRNYDGNAGRFGETSVAATSGDQSQLAVYAAERAGDGALTIMVINKTGTPLTSSLTLGGFTAGSAASRWRYDGTAPGAIVHAADVAVSGGALNATFPASSMTLLVVPRSGAVGTPTTSRTATPGVTTTKTATPVATATRTPTPVRTATGTPTPTTTLVRTATATSTPNGGAATPTRTSTSAVTATATSTPMAPSTATPSPVATPAGGAGSIAGTIRYAGDAVPLAGVTIVLNGSGAATTATDTEGRYAFGGLADATWDVVPVGLDPGVVAVGASDAAVAMQVARHVRTVGGLQAIACDAGADGKISLRDAKQLLARAVGLGPELPAVERCGSGWVFAPMPVTVPGQTTSAPTVSRTTCSPGMITLAEVAGGVDGQDFSAVVLGDCATDWRPTGAAGVPGASASLGMPIVLGSRVRIPLIVDAPGAFASLDAVVTFDAAAYEKPRARRFANGRHAAIAANAPTPGVLRIALASAAPMSAGPVVTIELRVVGGGVPPAVVLQSAVVGP